MAQRLGLRTSEHLLDASRIIWNSSVGFLEEHMREPEDRWLDLPPQGVRVPIKDGSKTGAVVILKRHEKRQALVAVSVFEPGVFP